MLRISILSLLLFLLMFASILLAADKPALVDGNGDPIPEHALARLGTVRVPYADRLDCVVYSPDGKVLASGGEDRMLHLWDEKSGRSIRQFDGHPGRISSLAFSPDGKLLISASNAEKSRPDQGSGGLLLWNVATGKLVYQLAKTKEDRCVVAFAPDGKTIASGDSSGVVRLWDTATGKLLRLLAKAPNNGSVTSLAFALDGKTLAATFSDGPIHFWALSTGKDALPEVKSPKCLGAVAFSPDGRVLAIAGNEGITVYRAAGVEEIHPFKGYEKRNRSLCFTPDSKTLVSGSEYTIHLWDVRSGDHVKEFRPCKEWLAQLVVSPDGKTIATTSESGAVDFWDIETGTTLCQRYGSLRVIEELAFLPNGKSVVLRRGNEHISSWSYRTGKESSGLKLPPGTDNCLLCSDRSSVAITTMEADLVIIDIPSSREIFRCRYDKPRYVVAISRDKKRAVLEREEMFCSVCEVWDLMPKKVIWSRQVGKSFSGYPLRKNMKLAFSQDLRMVAYEFYNKVIVEDLSSKKEIWHRPKTANSGMNLVDK